ncbi:SulP family inorganic anion transporter [Pragia fontium]|uniref:High affinity sulphate transporter 1 n=2 Tax=Pragia fontium TaxID=82985 RepID=A0AAJ4WC36_9GAMM|nr:SulP family inorganic anion transporter [Pragia fontium]GKX62602.1 sodium-independent anion transporter [Pragia fontium]SFD12056.1 high affinity sulphate transporter 1 [Pragia fontium DSM 5563 = ATCC 49100]
MFSKALLKWMPGLQNLLAYDKSWLKADVRAGLSVAAVALPVAIAYAELANVGAIVGLYSCVLPMIAYALFGSSRQLIVGPDATTCAVIAAVVTPLAAGNSEIQWQLTIIMTLIMGGWCILASKFRLGALADLLSQPILTGLLNGVAVTIMVGQVAKILGIQINANQLIEKMMAIPLQIMDSHLPTLGMSALTLLLLIVIKKFRSQWPAPLIAIIVATTLAWGFSLQQYGVETIGSSGFDSGLPVVHWGSFQPGLIRELVIPALNLALISFVSLMLTARSFAAKNGYDIEADAEFRALGIANIMSGLSQGFAISGADSRTAVNDANGGKSQLVSIIAALVIGLVVIFFTQPLQYIPVSALGVVLVYAAWSLMDLKGIWNLRRRNRQAFSLAIFTFVCVLLIGVIQGIGLAVLLGLLQFLRTVFRPTEQLLGVNEDGMIHSLGNTNTIKAVPGVMMYRFNSPLTYFNVAYFKRRILNLVDSTPFQPRWVVIDAVASFTYADISVLASIDELKRDLKIRQVKLVLAGRRTELTRWFKDNRPAMKEEDILLVPDLYLALKLIQSKESAHNPEEQ